MYMYVPKAIQSCCRSVDVLELTSLGRHGVPLGEKPSPACFVGSLRKKKTITQGLTSFSFAFYSLDNRVIWLILKEKGKVQFLKRGS